ncbi:hypothetical protein [Apilactobacillus xinyiensis]|uniref:hypothetical protein n=1 Tax=Apilactobacillus xinyiensis TaxID=2841032 RepID=UPI00200E3E92|nr:hypothetical protein [Apilactobacillus xinyiensis]MCL0330589.1 hypothetical protein [Apilactobacillus xinyiensis]
MKNEIRMKAIKIVKEMEYKEWKDAKNYIDMLFQYDGMNIADLDTGQVYRFKELVPLAQKMDVSEWNKFRIVIDSIFDELIKRTTIDEIPNEDITQAMDISSVVMDMANNLQ